MISSEDTFRERESVGNVMPTQMAIVLISIMWSPGLLAPVDCHADALLEAYGAVYRSTS